MKRIVMLAAAAVSLAGCTHVLPGSTSAPAPAGIQIDDLKQGDTLGVSFEIHNTTTINYERATAEMVWYPPERAARVANGEPGTAPPDVVPAQCTSSGDDFLSYHFDIPAGRYMRMAARPDTPNGDSFPSGSVVSVIVRDGFGNIIGEMKSIRTP